MELSAYINNLVSLRVPFESHCGQKPIVIGSNRCEAKEEENIRAVQNSADVIRRVARRFVPRISPYIRYNENSSFPLPAICSILPEFELFMYHEPRTFGIYKGTVDDDQVMYPAYDIATQVFLNRMWPFTTQFDGLVVENNWPLDQSNKTAHDPSPFLPYYNEQFKQALRNTPKWNVTLLDQANKFIHKHNTYGKESFEVLYNLAGSNMFAMTTSQWMSGTAAINRQNINATWSSIKRELVTAALGGISGHWLWSSPICGDNKDFHAENQTSLCIKWYLAATFLPLITIDCTTVPRDPTAFNTTERLHMIEALNRRQSLLPYFNTVLQKGPLLRPMFYQFPDAHYLENITTQFGVGDSLMIVPNLQPFQSHVHVLMPPGSWFEFWGGARVNSSEGQMATMTTLESELLTLIRAGSIVMIQHDPQQTAEETRLRSFHTLIIALKCNITNGTLHNCSASGTIFMLPTISFYFEATQEKLYITAQGDDFDPVCDWRNAAIWMNDIQHIKIYGLEERYNNYDTFRLITQWIDLCDLINDDVIVFDLV
ncbi:uncharacterized protein LOC126973143 isoform X2 [Leptidea sinapis]|nr:uncharacterized protein LOC126973143 isoform X2 [Leptidea sinapis]